MFEAVIKVKPVAAGMSVSCCYKTIWKSAC